MEYQSAREAAEKWGVTLRRVQGLLHEGRVPGAKKYGVTWLIPADAEKPGDPRREPRPQARPFYTLPRRCPQLLVTTLYRQPGSADAVAESLAQDGAAQALFKAQLAYMRGDVGQACALIDALPADEARPDLRMGVHVTRCLCAMYRGDAETWLAARHQLERLPCYTPEEEAARAFQLGHLALGLYDQWELPAWLCEGNFEPLAPDCYPLARFLYIKYRMLARRDPAVSLIAQPLVSQSYAEGALVSEIYCRLMLAIGYHEQGQRAPAAAQIDRVLALALPDRLIAPLVEYRNDLGTLLDERLALVDRDAARTMRKLNAQLTQSWTALNKVVRGVTYTASLSPQEHHAAKLAARGLSNAEIAGRMGVAVSTVKRHISGAMRKTGASGRAELARFIAMTPE